jgi:hypothetical protein
MIKNVTLWMLRNTSTFIFESTDNTTRRQLKIIKNKRTDWINKLLSTFLFKSRSNSSSHGIPQSEHTAYWNFMKNDNDGWEKVIQEVQSIGQERIHSTIQPLDRNSKKLINQTWNAICSSWRCYNSIFLIIKNTNNVDITFLNLLFNTFRCNIIFLKWKMTPWAHIFLNHYIYFETLEVRPVFLTCHAIEGHHRQIKRDFSHSLHSTKRRFGSSGLMDIMDIDNIILSLLKLNIFPWYKLNIPLGLNLKNKLPRGILINHLKLKYPIQYPRVHIDDIDDEDEIDNDVE